MGECSCGDQSSDLVLVIDNNRFINIAFYRGCYNCNNDAGIEIQPFDKKGEKSWLSDPWIKRVDVDFDEYGQDAKFIPLYNHNDLVNAFKELYDEIDGADEYDSAVDLLHDIPELLIVMQWYSYQRHETALQVEKNY